tara:strand:- start:517 stop:3753 length:3237 start_codon:yes stop_codon:yes gene_type:complete
VAIIKVETPQGVVDVEIEGDQPTPQEMADIDRQFFGSPQQQGAEIDLATASLEEIKEYIRQTEGAGAAGTAPQVAPPGAIEGQSVIDPSAVDYETGVKDIPLRMFVSRGDNFAEKVARLNQAGFGTDAILQDNKGEVIIDLDKVSDQTKTRYNIEGTGLRALDEAEGFTKEDIVEFFSETSGPLAGGITASLAASGYGLVPAAALAGAGSAFGYLVDEGFEYAQGLRRETTDDLLQGTAFEFVLGGAGEGLGRTISSVFGRMIKGPGGEEANAARALGRDLTTKYGGSPTVRAANLSPILGRLQAIYEGVFPNEGVAKQNAKALMAYIDDLETSSGIKSNVDKDELLKSLNKTISDIYGTTDDLVKEANKGLEETIDREINKLLKMFDTPDQLQGEAGLAVVKAMEVAKKSFDEDVSRLYKRADELLGGKERAFLPTANLVATAQAIGKESIDFKNSELYNFIIKLKDQNMTLSDANAIRTAIKHSEYDPKLVGAADETAVNGLIKAIDKSFDQAEVVARSRLAKSPKVGGVIGPNGKFIPRAEVESIAEGLDTFRKAQKLYGAGIERFRQVQAEKLFSDYKKAPGNFEPRQLLKEGFLIVPGDATRLKKFLRTIVPSGREAVERPTTLDDVVPNVEVDLGGGRVGSMRDLVKSLPENDPLRQNFEGRLRDAQRFADDVAAARGQGVAVTEAVRTTMARDYLQKVITRDRGSKTIVGMGDDGRPIEGYDAVKISEKLRSLGETGEVLFGKDNYKTVQALLADLSTVSPRLTEDQLSRMAALPIAEQRIFVNDLIKAQKEQFKGGSLLNQIAKHVQDGNVDKVVDTIFTKNNSGRIKQAQQVLPEDVMDEVRSLALQRILRVSGSVDDTSETFLNDLMTGANAKAVETALKAYGDDTLIAMFGKETTDGLKEFARASRALSNEPIKGLGALAPATIAGSLGIVGMLTAPLATLTTAGAIKGASMLLRSKPFLEVITKPTGVRPGQGVPYDKLGRALEATWETTAQLAQQGFERPSEEVEPTTETGQAQFAPTAMQSVTRAVTAPLTGLQTPQPSQVRNQVSSILIPNQATRSLAESLAK